MILETVIVGSLEVNCYVVAGSAGAKAIIIDPGADAREIKKILAKHKLTPGMVVNTHGHIDHIGADDKFAVPIYIHKEDAVLLKDPERNLSNFLSLPFSIKEEICVLEDGQDIGSDGVILEVMHIPGHTPGGIALLMKEPQNNILFSGDSLFCQGIGRTDFPGASEKVLIKAIREKLLVLPDETIVYPGHGPRTTIGDEKRGNPFLN